MIGFPSYCKMKITLNYYSREEIRVAMPVGCHIKHPNYTPLITHTEKCSRQIFTAKEK